MDNNKKIPLVERKDEINSLVDDINKDISNLINEQGPLTFLRNANLGKNILRLGIPVYNYLRKKHLKKDIKDLEHKLSDVEDDNELRDLYEKLLVLTMDLQNLAEKKGIIGKNMFDIEGIEGEEFNMGYEKIKVNFEPTEIQLDISGGKKPKKIISGIYDFDILLSKETPEGYIIRVYNDNISPFDSLLLYLRKIEKGKQRIELQARKGDFTTNKIESDVDIVKLY